MKILFLFFIILTVNIIPQNQTLFYEDFENGISDWTPVNLKDPGSPTLWRVTADRYVSPDHSLAWNDSTTNSYPNGLYQALESPPITIPYNARTFLKFKAFIHLTLNGSYYHDYFFVKYSTNNGTTWNNFLPNAVSGQQLLWRSFPEDFGPTASSELTYYAGKTMKFRIIASSDTLNPNGLGVFLDDFHIYSQECVFNDLNEPNNSTANATEVTLGVNFLSSLCPQNDEDVYKFTAEAGDQLNIVTQHSMFYTYLYLLNSSGFTLKNAYNEMTYSITTSGTYYIRVTGSYNYSANYHIYFNSRPEPDIISVSDIPDDQGLKVRVKWQSSFYDPQLGTGQIKEYQLWRKVNDSLSAGKNRIIKLLNNISDEEFWEHMTTVPALSNRPFVNYSYVAPTLADNEPVTFKIAAIPKVDTQPITWGVEGSGFSIDNLSPVVNNFNASITGSGIKLNWEMNSGHNDVSRYEIFKGVYDIFPPEPENRIAELNFPAQDYLDSDLLSGYTYYYIIAATDRSGNTTYSPAISAGAVTSVLSDEFSPKEFSLKQNYPNPFNPVTTIEFTLPGFSLISLKIYDIMGREIKEIVNGNFPPGTHKTEFDASGLTSGIYFYTLSAGNYQETKKLVLMK
jgi:hypothetical protein